MDEAEVIFRKVAEWSSNINVQDKLWLTLYLKGEFDSALEESSSTFSRTVIHHAKGNLAAADEALATLIKDKALLALSENESDYIIALAYAHRGEADESFEWLNRMLENDGRYSTFILTEPGLENLYSDERWPPFLEKLGLLQYWLDRTPK